VLGSLALVSDPASGTLGSTATWPAPVADGPVDAAIAVPGSKSQTNRALVIAALADAATTIHGPLRARDTDLMVAALRSLGTQIDALPQADALIVTPGPLHGDASIECGLAGTVMRFVPPVAALADGAVHFDGDPHARRRPMQPMLDALRSLGVDVTTQGPDALPFTVGGTGKVSGGPLFVDASMSSQFVSGLLLAGCRYDDGLTLTVTDGTPSRPHIDMTLSMLRDAGVPAQAQEPGTWRVAPSLPRAGDTTIAPDLSNAAPFLAAALLTGGTVRIPRWAAATSQPGGHIVGVFEAMGGTARFEGDALVMSGSGRITGAALNLRDVPELVTTVAVLATVADRPSTISGVGHVRGHETDRLAALADELNALGAIVLESDDGLQITPRPLHGGTFHTYADHRLATAAAVLGLVIPGIEVVDIATTNKTLPDFPTLWSSMLAGRAT
jgi:3-phosphoshikimate 1-carboxyvinyltransferase